MHLTRVLARGGWVDGGFMAGGGALHALYVVLPRRGYAAGDLSVVHPLARGDRWVHASGTSRRSARSRCPRCLPPGTDLASAVLVLPQTVREREDLRRAWTQSRMLEVGSSRGAGTTSTRLRRRRVRVAAVRHGRRRPDVLGPREAKARVGVVPMGVRSRSVTGADSTS